VRRWLFVPALLLLVLAGFAAGRVLAGRSQAAQAFDFNAASYRAPAGGEGRSVAGFSGLEDGSAISGSPLLSGKVGSLSGRSLIIATQTGPATLQLDGNRPLWRLAPAVPSDVATGASVIVRLDKAGDGATGVLVIAAP
jgi:hypothetical protein